MRWRRRFISKTSLGFPAFKQSLHSLASCFHSCTTLLNRNYYLCKQEFQMETVEKIIEFVQRIELY